MVEVLKEEKVGEVRPRVTKMGRALIAVESKLRGQARSKRNAVKCSFVL
jgi:hypothetical protein